MQAIAIVRITAEGEEATEATDYAGYICMFSHPRYRHLPRIRCFPYDIGPRAPNTSHLHDLNSWHCFLSFSHALLDGTITTA